MYTYTGVREELNDRSVVAGSCQPYEKHFMCDVEKPGDVILLRHGLLMCDVKKPCDVIV